MTIKGKFLIPIITLTAVCAAAVLLATILLFNSYVDGVMSDRINAAAAVAENTLKSLEAQSYNASQRIAKDPEIIRAIQDGDHEALINRAITLQKDSGVEFCTIGDSAGIALARPHKPESYGDDITSMPSVKSALSGKNMTVIEEGVSVRMSLCSGTPIYDNSGILVGIVTVGFRMDTNTYIDSIKSLMGCEATVFIGDERLSTTVLKDDGTRAVGTKSENKVSADVLAGKTYSGKVKILGHDALTKYSPLYGVDGKVIGMLFVGHYMTEKTDTIWSFVGGGLLIMAAILIIGIFVAVLISRTIEGQVRRIVTGIRNSARKIESATIGLTEISSNLAEGSSKQAASIEETSATMNESASMIAQNAENARSAALMAQESKQNADIGNDKMRKMVESMDQLKESSNTISKIIKTIDDIAFQTNLLAINATVEAARAGGDAGRSFAVVAEEVRALAKRSADAAADTTEIIKKNIALTNSGREISGEVSNALQSITAESEKLNKIISEVSLASEEQSNGIKQINIAVSQMEKVTQQTAAMAEEAAASSQNLNEETITLEQIVAEASKLVKNI